MAFSRHFYPEYNFAFTQCFGILDDHSLRVHILSFNIEAKGMQKIRELADARQLENASKITVQGLVELAELGNERAAGRDGLLAIVVPENKPLLEKMARFYGMAISGHKQAIEVFYDVREAISWLGYHATDTDTLLRFVNQNRL